MDKIFFHNSLSQWLYTGITIFTLLLIVKLFALFINKKLTFWAKRTATKWDDYIVEAFKTFILPLLYIAVVYFPVKQLILPELLQNMLHFAFISCLTFFTIRFIAAAIRKIIYSYIDEQNDNDAKRKQARGLIIIINVIISIGCIVFLADNLGYNVTTLIAGMGIGGIAIALAAQNILGDLFCYFSIIFDKPFEIGDFVVIDDKAGTIEQIGIKTTRVRNREGDQLVFSNADITGSRLHNYKKMQQRRVVFSIGVVYGTSHQKLKEIPDLIKGIIEQENKTTFNRGHLKSMGDFSINYEFVYFIDTADYTEYMDIQQDIYLHIYKIFEEQQIEFAFPTQTVFVEQTNKGNFN